MIPNSLLKYKISLEEHSKTSIVILEDKIDELIVDPTKFTQSKYLGYPFTPLNTEYPNDTNGMPLIPTIQINFEELPNVSHFPKKGILQLFFPQAFPFVKPEDIIIRYIKEEALKEPHVTDFSFLTKDVYKNVIFESIYKLSFKKSISWSSPNDSQYKFEWHQIKELLKAYEIEEDIQEELEDCSLEEFIFLTEDINPDLHDDLYNYFYDDIGSKIDGYGYFINGDPRCNGNNDDNILLLQIDGSSEDVFNEEQSIYFYAFISKEDLLNLNFNNVIIDWQITD